MSRGKNDIEKSGKPIFLIYLKAGILIGLTLFGMFVLSIMSRENVKEQTQTEPATMKSIKEVQKVLKGDELARAIDSEIRTNDAYKNTLSNAQHKSEEVLGEAVKLKDQAIQDSKDYVTDYLYEQTVGVMIDNLLKKLPERQKERVLQNICK